MIVGFNNALQKSKVSRSIGRIGFVNNRIIMRNPTSSAKSLQKKNPLNPNDREDLRMAGIAGFEPTSDGVKVRCLTAWLYPSINECRRHYKPAQAAFVLNKYGVGDGTRTHDLRDHNPT